MYVVNFYGAPCTGKSTYAADIFQRFKKYYPDLRVELVTEVAKDLCWEGSKAIKDQLYVAGEQEHRLNRLLTSGNVDVAISDAPIMLQAIYYDINGLPNLEEFEKVMYGHNKMYDNINFMLCPRSRINYENAGRNYDFEEQDLIHSKIISLMNRFCIPFITITDDIDSAKIVKDILRAINYKSDLGDDFT